MSNGGTIALTYIINNSSFNSKISDMKKNLQTLQTACKNSAREVDLYGTNLETLGKRQASINDSIKQAEKIMRTYRDGLTKNKSALSSNQTELTKLAAKKKELTTEYKNAVKVYGAESTQAKALKTSLEQVTNEYNTMSGKVKTNENNIKNYTSQIERTKGTILDLQNQLKTVNSEMEKQANGFLDASQKFATAGTALEEAGGKISDLGEKVRNAGIMMVTSAAGMATLSAGFESGLHKVNTLVMDNEEGLASYGDEVLQLSRDTGKSTTDLTDSLYDAISAGVEYTDSIEYMNKINKLAVGGFTDIGSASNLMTQIMNIYHKSVGDVTDVSDKLFLVQKNGVTTIAQLATSMGDALTIGANYNVSLEQILAAYASLTKQGRTADVAQTQLKSTIQELGDTGSAAGKLLQEKTGKSFTQLMEEGKTLYDVIKILQDACGGAGDEFNNLFGNVRSGLGAMALVSNEGEYFNETLSDMANASGMTEEAFGQMADTSEGRMKKALNNLKVSFTELGQSLLPMMDQVSSGISDIAKFLSKLNPNIVTGIAKFGAMAIVFGTVTKATGSLVTLLGKGATGLSTLFKIMADTKATGSFIKALSNSGTTIGNLTNSVTTLGTALGGTGGAIALAVTAVATLGIAIYNNQKEIKESEAAYESLGGKIGDFTGRLRSDESIWTQIFGKEYSWKFSDEYKAALDNAETDVANWVETLKGYQQQIYDILNSTEISQQTKDEQVATIIKDTIGAGDIDTQAANLRKGLIEKGYNREDTNKIVNDFRKGIEQQYTEIEGLELKGLEMVKKYTKQVVDESGNVLNEVDWEGFMNEFQPMLEEKHEAIVTSQNQNVDDLLEISQRYADQQGMIYGKAEEGTMEYNNKTIENSKKAKLEQIKADEEWAKEHGILTEDYKNQLYERRKSAEDTYSAQSASLQRLALYDEEYAKQNGLTTQKLNDNAWMVKDSMSGLTTTFFDNEEALKQWADATMQSTTTVQDEFGNTKTVVMDAAGNIVAMVDEGAGTFRYFKDEAQAACNGVIEQMGLTNATAEEKFAAICGAIDDGTLSAKDFGMTDEEFKAVAQEMINTSGDANALKANMEKIPKNVSTKVEVSGTDSANSKINGIWDSLKKFAGKTFTATVNVVKQGVSTLAGNLFGFETGGTVNESGLYTTQEAGLELIDTASPTTTAYSLGKATRGELTYIPANSKVTNAAMTTLKMESMIDKKLDSAMNLYMARLEKQLVAVMKNNGGNGDLNITMNNPNFADKGSETANINNVKRIINSMK